MNKNYLLTRVDSVKLFAPTKAHQFTLSLYAIDHLDVLENLFKTCKNDKEVYRKLKDKVDEEMTKRLDIYYAPNSARNTGGGLSSSRSTRRSRH